MKRISRRNFLDRSRAAKIESKYQKYKNTVEKKQPKHVTKTFSENDFSKVDPKLCGSDIWTLGSGLSRVWGSVVDKKWSKKKS